jgi:flagellar basal-body rod protein FlgB
MLSTLFGTTTVPLLEQVVNFTEARHGVLAGNIANLDTPGYKTQDLSPELFQQKLREAVETSQMQPEAPAGFANYTFGNESLNGGGSNGVGYGNYEMPASSPMSQVDRNFAAFDKVKDSFKSILRHDGVNVSMENQVNQMVKNQQEHNLAAGILSQQFRLLRVAISERVA